MGLFSSIGGLLGAGIGSIFGPVGTVVGGMIGGSGGSAVDANRANKKQEGYYNQQMDFAKSQDQFQRDYVHNAMQWRVEDAKQAGVHPMAALGFQSPNYSPVSTPSAPSYMDSSEFDTGSTFGQTVNNAVFAAKTQKQQLEAGQLSNRGLELQNQHLELTNMQLASDIQRASMTTKAKPDVNGQGSLGVIGGQQDAIPSGRSITSGTSPLLGASRLGNAIFLHLNPEISDSVTEDFVKNTLANIAIEGKMHMLMPEIAQHLTQRELDALKRGDATLEHVNPGQIEFLWKPHTAPHYYGNKQTVRGKIIF